MSGAEPFKAAMASASGPDQGWCGGLERKRHKAGHGRGTCHAPGLLACEKQSHELRERPYRVTMSCMKSDTITVRLDDDLAALLEQACRSSGRTRSEVMREALRRHLAQLRFEQLRRRVMPFAEARGYLTDEDVFNQVS